MWEKKHAQRMRGENNNKKRNEMHRFEKEWNGKKWKGLR